MAKNRNKKKEKNGAVSMDVSDLPQGTSTNHIFLFFFVIAPVLFPRKNNNKSRK
jgi:hypothetical protein